MRLNAVDKDINPETGPTHAGPNRLLLSLVLRGGVIASASLLIVGLGLFLITGDTGYAAGNLYTGTGTARQFLTFHDITVSGQETYFPTEVPQIWQDSLAFKPFALIMLGILVLIATPVLNLLLIGWGFVQQKNRPFTLICLLVLVILAISFFVGKAGG
ncbi:MAG: hypothetical protein JWP00_4250 [Chloroflexi bacterium]|nr:hypothetical protein [Chloroflexota bacterium]